MVVTASKTAFAITAMTSTDKVTPAVDAVNTRYLCKGANISKMNDRPKANKQILRTILSECA